MVGRPRKIDAAKRHIVDTLNRSGRTVFTPTDLRLLFGKHRQDWRLSKSMSLNDFIAFLVDECDLEPRVISLPYRPVTRYLWNAPSPFDVVQSINPTGYFSHYSAIYLNELTTQVPKVLYFNVEQRGKGGGGDLSQGSIDLAFKRPGRVSTNTADIGNGKVCIISGKNTGNLGVVQVNRQEVGLRVTNVERTLIDAAVRPVYAGGVHEVARAFRAASESVSVKRLVAYLRALDYTYPFHQCVGFYMERAGNYSNEQISQLDQFPKEFDFYIDYGMKQVDYVSRWKLFVPKGF